MTPDEVRALPVTVPWWPVAAQALGYGQHSAYTAAKEGSAPVPRPELTDLRRRLCAP